MHGSQGCAFVARETVASLLEEERLHAYAPLIVDEEGYAFVEDLVAALADGEDMFQVRFHMIRNTRIENVGKSQSCMVSNLRRTCFSS